MKNRSRIFAKGGFEFRLTKDENGHILSQFRHRVFGIWWSKWYDWFYSADVESGMNRLLKIKEKYDGKKIRTPIQPTQNQTSN